MNFATIKLGSATLAACLIVGIARAATPDAAPSVTVPYGDLNLATAQGAQTLHARLTAAARQVCAADGIDGRDLGASAAVRSCETQAIASAVSAVHAPQLAASFAARRE